MTDKIDLSPFNLLIVTPSMDGSVDLNYQNSLKYTEKLIEEHGGKCSAYFVKYVSDIAYARAKLFSEFVRKKEFTHLLFIDADMGFHPQEVAYFLLLQRDFISAVGPKKTYPIEFAYNMNDDNGNLVPLYHELDTNVAEVPFVGGAFVMISRNCANRLAESYPELQYYSPDGKIEYGVFDPVILTENGQKRRLSEDYAFCHRWKKIGGKIEAKLDAHLTHTGYHTFEGSLHQHLIDTQPSFVEKQADG